MIVQASLCSDTCAQARSQERRAIPLYHAEGFTHLRRDRFAPCIRTGRAAGAWIPYENETLLKERPD